MEFEEVYLHFALVFLGSERAGGRLAHSPHQMGSAGPGTGSIWYMHLSSANTVLKRTICKSQIFLSLLTNASMKYVCL